MLTSDWVAFSEMFQGWSPVFNLVMISDNLLCEKGNYIIMDDETKIEYFSYFNIFFFLTKVLYVHCQAVGEYR